MCNAVPVGHFKQSLALTGAPRWYSHGALREFEQCEGFVTGVAYLKVSLDGYRAWKRIGHALSMCYART